MLITVGSGLFLAASQVMPSNRIFLVAAGLFLAWLIFAMFTLRHYMRDKPQV